MRNALKDFILFVGIVVVCLSVLALIVMVWDSSGMQGRLDGIDPVKIHRARDADAGITCWMPVGGDGIWCERDALRAYDESTK